jgi:ligand-binding sensor domain-containing protein
MFSHRRHVGSRPLIAYPSKARHSINNPNLDNNHIHALIEDSHGQLWAGTNSGLSCWNPRTDKWVNILKKGMEKPTSFYRSAKTQTETSGQALMRTVYTSLTAKLNIIAHHTQPTGILAKTGFVFDILKDKDGDMWLAGTREKS